MHITMSFADGSPARISSINTALRHFRPSFIHIWELKTFWHERIICEDDVEVRRAGGRARQKKTMMLVLLKSPTRAYRHRNPAAKVSWTAVPCSPFMMCHVHGLGDVHILPVSG